MQLGLSIGLLPGPDRTESENAIVGDLEELGEHAHVGRRLGDHAITCVEQETLGVVRENAILARAFVRRDHESLVLRPASIRGEDSTVEHDTMRVEAAMFGRFDVLDGET